MFKGVSSDNAELNWLDLLLIFILVKSLFSLVILIAYMIFPSTFLDVIRTPIPIITFLVVPDSLEFFACRMFSFVFFY